MKERAHFSVMVPEADRHRIIAVFYVDDQADLLRQLKKRLPGLRKDHALVALNEQALAMVLRASLRRPS